LFAHEESRTELFGRVQRIADALAGNQATLPFDSWTVSEARIPLRVWPWRIVKAPLPGGSYDYVATLIGDPQTEFLGIHLVRHTASRQSSHPRQRSSPYTLSVTNCPDASVGGSVLCCVL
jgi:hypothetical protein